jgi:secreted PhoX family phosphatase
MKISRRSLLKSGSLAVAASGSMLSFVSAAKPAAASWSIRPQGMAPFRGYGNLVPDPNGLLDLPRGFQYAVFSVEGDALSGGGRVPSLHDGMAAFPALLGANWLVRNHEVSPEDVEDGLIPVAHVPGATYDPEGTGGTTTLLVGAARRLLLHRVSLAGTSTNCAGGPTPWHTWLTCEETTDAIGKPHGFVFEVDPQRGGNPEPIAAMGRFEHEAVSFGLDGTAYLTEDADSPHGCLYRFRPMRPLGGRNSLHAGGILQAMRVLGLAGTDLSAVQIPNSIWKIEWIAVTHPDPADGDPSVREQAQALGATPIPKCEGTWVAADGAIWFVSSRGDGPDAEDEEDRSAAVHAGQIWRLDPYDQTIQLIAVLHPGTPLDEPDNLTMGPHGFAVACTDGNDDQWLFGITDEGGSFALARNAENEEEFAGATFSRDGQTLFANVQGPPGRTYAIWGPWRR